MRRRTLVLAAATTIFAVVLSVSPVAAQSWRNHPRYHDELGHREFHRGLEHRDAHRYPMSPRQHGELHEYLGADRYRDRLEHRGYHRELNNRYWYYNPYRYYYSPYYGNQRRGFSFDLGDFSFSFGN